MSYSWPDHPRFEPGDLEVKTNDVRRVLEACTGAVEQAGGRQPIEQRDRPVLKRICNTLEVGRFHENHLQLDESTFTWGRKLTQAAARESLGDGLPVGTLLGFLDEPQPRGLDRATSGLIIRVFALTQDLAWFREGVAVDAPAVDQVTAAYELRKPDLPDVETWKRAVAGARVVDVRVTELLSAANVTRLVSGVREAAERSVEGARELDRLLAQHREDLGAPEVDAPRYATAAAVKSLLENVKTHVDPADIVQLVADVDWPTSAEAAQRSLTSAPAVTKSLHAANWEVLRALASVTDARRDAATSLIARLRDAARHDELSSGLADELRSVERDAVRLLTLTAPAPVPPALVEPSPAHGGGTVSVAAQDVEQALTAIRQVAAEHPDATLTVTWQVGP